MINKNQDLVCKLSKKLLKSKIISSSPLSYIYKRHIAFTLAEVLITLLIIGIVASIIIPVLIQDIQDAQYKTAWKSNFANLSQLVRRITLENGGSFKYLFSDDNAMKNIFKTYLNYIKECPSGGSAGICWHDTLKWKELNGTARSDTNYASLALNNGVLLGFQHITQDCSDPIGSSGRRRCGRIFIDINGFKSPNVIGKDIFAVHIMENNVLPLGIDGSDADDATCIKPPDSGYNDANNKGFGCSADYLYQ